MNHNEPVVSPVGDADDLVTVSDTNIAMKVRKVELLQIGRDDLSKGIARDHTAWAFVSSPESITLQLREAVSEDRARMRVMTTSLTREKAYKLAETLRTLADSMPGGMVELGDRNYALISRGAQMCGTLNPDEIFPAFEEQLYCHEAQEVYDFLKWCHEENKLLGSGNYEQRFAEFKTNRLFS